MMIRLIMAFAMLCGLSQSPMAQTEAECGEVVQRVLTSVGASLVRKTDLGNYHLRHPSVESVVVSCGALPLGISLGFGRFDPSVSQLASRAGSVLTGESVGTVTRLIVECRRIMLADPMAMDTFRTDKADVECSDATISVYRAQRRD